MTLRLLSWPSGEAWADGETVGRAMREGAILNHFPAYRDPTAQLSDLERGMLARVLSERPRWAIEQVPEGRKIRQVYFLPQEVFGPEDFFPSWFNIFHATTRASVLESQWILEPGEVFQRQRVREALRVLLDPRVVSAVVVVPLKVEEGPGGEVDLLVITRDVWSFRLNSNFQLTGSVLDYLFLSLGEENFLGYQKRAAVAFLLEPDVWSIGPLYADNLLFGSRHQLKAHVMSSFNNDTQAFEGLYGSVQVGLPFYNQYTHWSWDLSVDFHDVITRRFSAGQVRRYPIDAQPGEETIPWVYRNRATSGELTGSYALIGGGVRQEFTTGWGIWYQGAQIPDASQYSETLRASFEEEVLPRADFWSYPLVEYRIWTPRYSTFFNLETYGLGEDVAMGLDTTARAFGGGHFTGSRRDFVGFSSAARYRLGVAGDDILTFLVKGDARYEPSLGWVGLITGGGLGYVSPALWNVFRLHIAGQTQLRERDLSNGFSSLGGDNGLRGYASSALIGEHMLRVNVEARTLPLYLWSVPVGMVAFWDAGDAFDDFATFRLYQGVGVGLRWVLLQFNRQVYRLDWSFGLQNQSVWPGLVTFGFEQAF